MNFSSLSSKSHPAFPQVFPDAPARSLVWRAQRRRARSRLPASLPRRVQHERGPGQDADEAPSVLEVGQGLAERAGRGLPPYEHLRAHRGW